MDIYAQNILDHYKSPRNQGEISSPSATVEIVNYSCGDQITMDLEVKEEKISDLKFRGSGCAISQASCSILSEEIIGYDLTEAENLKKKDIYEMLGVPISERRSKCALISLLALKNCIRKFRGEPEIKWSEIYD